MSTNQPTVDILAATTERSAAAAQHRRRDWLRHVEDGATYGVLGLFTLFTLYPLLWMVFGSLKSSPEFYSNIWGPPTTLSLLGNFGRSWQVGDIGTYMLNSVIATSGALIVVLVCATAAAYAFARVRFPGRRVLYYSFLASMMIPPAVTMIPLFVVVRDLGLLNTRLSLVLVYASTSLAFSIFILHAFFLSIPRELEEAAWIDGCNRFNALIRVILPLTKPAMAMIVVFDGITFWNDFLVALLLIQSESLRTIPLGLVIFTQRYTTDWPLFFAALTIVTVPIVVAFILMQRQFITGLTAGALKG